MAHHVRVLNDRRIEGDLAPVVELLRGARYPLALTGAGISTDSGIADFRSPGGLWSVFPPMEYATLSCFLSDPARAWRMFRAMAREIEGKRPNAAHRALADLERAGRLRAVVTQNVDGLHRAAGSRTVLEIHGGGDHLRCLRCGHRDAFVHEHLSGPVPGCPACGYPLKPDVVLFEELPRELDRIRQHVTRCDVLLSVGTSAEVVPAAQFAHDIVDSGGAVIEFNLAATALTPSLGSDSALVLGRARVTVPLVVEAVLSTSDAEAS